MKGTTYFQDRSRFWVQTNNGVEAILRAALPRGMDGVPHGWLETCGPTAAVNVMDSMGLPITVKSPTGEPIRPMDYLTLWMNTPQNWKLLSSVVPGLDSDKLLENEVGQFYPLAVKMVFGASVAYIQNPDWNYVKSLVSTGHGVMIALKSPGHYLAVIGVDSDADVLIYNDSWPARTGTDGFNLKMANDEWTKNVQPFALIFG